jgi:hypothetical protein
MNRDFFLIFAESFEVGVIFGVGGAGRLEDQPVSEEPGKGREEDKPRRWCGKGAVMTTFQGGPFPVHS